MYGDKLPKNGAFKGCIVACVIGVVLWCAALLPFILRALHVWGQP